MAITTGYMPPEVSLVIPAYNEESRLENAVDRGREELEKFLDDDFEIIVVEDGCTDHTPEIAQRAEKQHQNVKHLHFDKRKGRGRALEKGFTEARGELLCYMDTDLSADPSSLPELVNKVSDGGFDIVTGSRRMEDSDVERSFARSLASAGYNSLVRLLLESGVRDHQCGFKAFTKDSIEDLADETRWSHWFWDTEVLIRAQRKGYRVGETPIKWMEEGDSSVELARDTLNMGFKTFSLFLELQKKRYLPLPADS